MSTTDSVVEVHDPAPEAMLIEQVELDVHVFWEGACAAPDDERTEEQVIFVN